MNDRTAIDLPALEYELLRGMIRDLLGIDYPPNKRELMRVRLEGRLRALGVRRFSDYYRLLRYAPAGQPEWLALADCVTNNETYFFREHLQFVQLTEIATHRGTERTAPLRVLSAGCSSGEEAYSLGATLAACLPPTAFDVLGVDVSAAKLAEASVGRYGDRSFRADESPPPGVDLDRFLAREPNGGWMVRPGLRGRIRFERLNLVEPQQVARLGTFDVVFCRNVLIYGHEASVPRFLRALEQLVRPGGHLFLGHAESLLGRRSLFRPERVGGGFAYVRERDSRP
jgi:chemotaxis protein methyltransferase CheR